MRIDCCGEVHTHGGQGHFLLGRAEALLEPLIAQYGGQVRLIYLDPPFGTGDTFRVRVDAGGKRVNLPVFHDTLPEKEYLEWMRVVLSGARELLSADGSIYLHIDYRMSAKLRLMMDELFGERRFMNEIIWAYHSGGRSTRYYPRKHDTLLFYKKGAKAYFDISAVGSPRGAAKRNHMKRYITEDGRVAFSIRSGGKLYTYFEDTPTYPSDVWDDIEHLQQKDRERVGYATQKPESLLKRVVLASSAKNDIVCDLFSGSGTTASVCAKLGRRFVAADASPFALYTLRARLLKNAADASLFSSAQELRLDYPPDKTPAVFSCGVETHKGRRMICVYDARFEGDYPLVYAAFGKASGERFYPIYTNFCPVLPLTFPLDDLSDGVVQFVDAMGRQAFFTLEKDERSK